MSSSQTLKSNSKNLRKSKSALSTKGYHGSSNERSTGQSSSATDKSERNRRTDNNELVDRFVKDERDYRSNAVGDYDAHQDHAKRMHREELEKIVGRQY